jgi:hypothetical protein
MNLIRMLEAAQGGQLFANVAAAIKADPQSTRAAMEALCPAIAQQLLDAARADDGLMQSLVEVLEDGAEGSPLQDADALTGRESIDDGQMILEDVYGSTDEALEALGPLVSGVSAPALRKLAAISATAVVAALTQAQMPMTLTGTQQAMGGGGILGTIMDALVKGVVSEATRQIRQRTGIGWGTRRRTTRKTTARKTTARKTSTRKKAATRKTSTRRKPSSSISIESIIRDMLGNTRK